MDSISQAEMTEGITGELWPIVGNNGARGSEPVEYVLPYKLH